MAIVTLTSDFGTRDGYVGEMKGVVLERAPSARLVDVTHDVPPGDVWSGAWTLSRVWTRFPPGTIHLAVVDPGVGTDRRAAAVRIAGRWLVGPDNGLLTLASGEVEAARELDPGRVGLEPFSDTFHGRDLFAPAAGHLASGGDPGGLGPPLEAGSLIRLPVPAPERDGERLRGRVVHVDRFGNLVTDLPSEWLPTSPTASVGDYTIAATGDSFAAVEPGDPVLIRGSGGTLEICVRDASAAEVLGVGRGESVEVRPGGA